MTVTGLLKRMGACNGALKKYSNSGRAFKHVFINAHWKHAQWFGGKLFGDWPFNVNPAVPPLASRYPELPRSWSNYYKVETHDVGELFRSRKNRIKYWGAVKRRLQELGVKL